MTRIGEMTNTQNAPLGFICADQFGGKEECRVFYIEYCGKDISFNRWRFHLYYETHLAMCHFEESESAALEFLSKNAPFCFADYSEFNEVANGVSRRKITDYSGKGKMHNTDTRVAFCDFVDQLARSGDISDKLAQKVTL